MKKLITSLSLSKNKIIIILRIKDVPVNTSELPETINVLESHLPSIFKNKCFNGRGLSFYKEAQETEVAHLFEHILLEYMCLLKIKYVNKVSYDGRTFWNRDENSGEYRIEIQCHLSDWPFFYKALREGTRLMDLIFTRSSVSLQTKEQFVS